VTGLSAEDNYLYLASVTQNKAYRYTLPSIVSRTDFATFTDYSETRDIAKVPYSLDLVWVASDNVMVPLACYNTDGVRVAEITYEQVPCARGLAMDPSGYILWVSDPVNDLLYEIDVSLSLENQTWGALKTVAY
jgi:hypothetical protein